MVGAASDHQQEAGYHKCCLDHDALQSKLDVILVIRVEAGNGSAKPYSKGRNVFCDTAYFAKQRPFVSGCDFRSGSKTGFPECPLSGPPTAR